MSTNSPTMRTLLDVSDVDRLPELELWDAWVSAAGDATRALRAWEEAGAEEAAAAFVVYGAALDREERAATVLGDCVAQRIALRRRELVAA